MYLSRAKNLIIVLLIFLAIYQTANLWFENFSSHRFFYLIKNSYDKHIMQKETSNTIESIIINTGNNKFLRQYNNISSAEYKKVFDDAIITCTKRGDFSYVKKFDLNYILDNKAVIYDYAYNSSGKDLNNIFNLKLKNLSKVGNFDKIILFPDINSNTNLQVIFFYSETSEAYIFNLSRQGLAQNIYNFISNFSGTENKNLYYISSLKSGMDLFKENQFIPKFKNGNIELKKAEAVNPLDQDGGVLLSGLERYINIFFDNPAIKWSSSLNNTYTYNDDNTVVKYYTNGVLEYVNYRTYFTGQEFNPYKAAIQFLEKDSNIKNEYYLTDYKEAKDGITFYFDYKINNFPIRLSEEIKESTNMKSMIEVTVYENKVYKYKRLVYNFNLKDEKTFLNINFVDALDKIFLEREDKNIRKNIVDKIDFVYKFDESNFTLSHYWIVKIGDTVYFEKIEESD